MKKLLITFVVMSILVILFNEENINYVKAETENSLTEEYSETTQESNEDEKEETIISELPDASNGETVISISGSSIIKETTTEPEDYINPVSGGAIKPILGSTEPIIDYYSYNIDNPIFFDSIADTRNANIAYNNYISKSFMSEMSYRTLYNTFSSHSHSTDCYVGHRHTDACSAPILNTLTFYATDTPENLILYQHSDGQNGNYVETYRFTVTTPTAYVATGRRYHLDGWSNVTERIEITFSYAKYQEGIGVTNGSYWIMVDHYLYSNTYVEGWTYGQDPRRQEGEWLYYAKNPNWDTYVNLLHTLYYNSSTQESLIKNLMKFGYVPGHVTYQNALNNIGSPYLKTVNYGDPYYFCKQVQDETPLCHNVVISIEPESTEQTVYLDTDINKNILITRLNGTVDTVIGNTDFIPNTIGDNQTATYSYTGLVGNAKTNSTLTATAKINVVPNLASISVTASESTLYNGNVPTFTVIANYADGNTKTLSEGQYTRVGWSEGFGIKDIRFRYTEGGKTVIYDISITVLPNVVALNVIPDSSVILYGQDTTFTIKAKYEDDSERIVGGTITKSIEKTNLGVQEISATYTENGIVVNASCNVEVLDYPTNLSVTLENDYIYQSQLVNLLQNTVTMASGNILENVILIEGNYDNVSIGSTTVEYSYTLNGVVISCNKVVEVKADLKDLIISSENLTISKNEKLKITVKAIYNVSGEVILPDDSYTVIDFDNTVYSRESKKYIIRYTDRGITIDNEINIIVLPEIIKLDIECAAETVEGSFVKFTATITYEDNLTKEIVAVSDRLKVNNYNISDIGYQDIEFEYTEGLITLKKSARIRVRALINISVPTIILLSIEPNEDKLIASDLVFVNNSKESVRITLNKIDVIGNTDMIDVLPDEHENWKIIGTEKSKKIAIGIDYLSSNWKSKSLEKPLYIKEMVNNTEIGIIDKTSASSLKIVGNYGTAFNTARSFGYNIYWSIELADN